MQLVINKTKIYFYLISFLFLTTISNNNLMSNLSKNFQIKEIKIQTNSKNLNAIILSHTNHLIHKNIFLINNKILLKKLENLNFLENLRINKNYPSTIVLNFRETKLLAYTYINQKKYFVGENRNFIDSNIFENDKNLPIIFGKFEIDNFLNLKKELSNQNINFNKINKFYFHKNKRWDLYYDNNIIIKLPNQNISNAISLFKKLKSNTEIESGAIIDLRIKNRLILKNE